MSAQILDGTPHRGRDPHRTRRARRQAGRAGNHARASAPYWSATTPAATRTSPASTATAPRSAIASIRRELPADATQEQVEAVIDELNADPACTGYIVQLPLPRGLDANAVLERMDPAKDADGLHPVSLGRLALGVEAPLPCTPRGIVELLRRHDVPLAGARVCVIGRGITVGRPLGLLLTRRSENATVTLCHTGTKDLAWHVREADIVIAAAGSPGLITAEMLRPGAVVLDVGITRTDEGLIGDVHPDAARVAGWVAPMPGGVGPMTRAMLLANVVEAAERNAA